MKAKSDKKKKRGKKAVFIFGCGTAGSFARKNRLERRVDTTSSLCWTDSEESSFRQINSPHKVYWQSRGAAEKEKHTYRLRQCYKSISSNCSKQKFHSATLSISLYFGCVCVCVMCCINSNNRRAETSPIPFALRWEKGLWSYIQLDLFLILMLEKKKEKRLKGAFEVKPISFSLIWTLWFRNILYLHITGTKCSWDMFLSCWLQIRCRQVTNMIKKTTSLEGAGTGPRVMWNLVTTIVTSLIWSHHHQ